MGIHCVFVKKFFVIKKIKISKSNLRTYSRPKNLTRIDGGVLENLFLKIYQKWQENSCNEGRSFKNLQAYTYKKEVSISLEFYKIFSKNCSVIS